MEMQNDQAAIQKAAMLVRMAPAVKTAMAIVSERLLAILGIVANMILFAAIMWNPSWERVAAGAIFGVITFALVLGARLNRGAS